MTFSYLSSNSPTYASNKYLVINSKLASLASGTLMVSDLAAAQYCITPVSRRCCHSSEIQQRYAV